MQYLKALCDNSFYGQQTLKKKRMGLGRLLRRHFGCGAIFVILSCAASPVLSDVYTGEAVITNDSEAACPLDNEYHNSTFEVNLDRSVVENQSFEIVFNLSESDKGMPSNGCMYSFTINSNTSSVTASLTNPTVDAGTVTASVNLVFGDGFWAFIPVGNSGTVSLTVRVTGEGAPASA